MHLPVPKLPAPGPTAVALCAVALLGLAASPAHAGDGTTVRFVIKDLDSTKGRVLCGLYANEDKWLSPDYYMGVEGKPRSDGKAVCVFHDVPPGVYAISAFHDEDDDQEFDRGLFGIPKEDYCASNDAYRRFGPPSWEDAIFRVGDKPVRMSAPVH